MVNHYKTLGLPNYASLGEVRKAYLKKIRLYHPDVNKSAEAEEISKNLNVAKEALENAARKASYDRNLKYSLEYKITPQRAYQPTRPVKNPISMREKIRRHKARKQEGKIKDYVQGLKRFPLAFRYVACAVYGAFGYNILMYVLIQCSLIMGIVLGFVASVLWFSAVSFFVNEYYKYEDYKARTKPLKYDLDKRTGRMFYLIYILGFAVAVIIRWVAFPAIVD